MAESGATGGAGWVLMEALVLEVQIQAAVQANSYRYLGAIIS